MVVGERHRQRIEAELQQADGKAHRQHCLQRQRRQYGQWQAGEQQQDARRADQHRAVVAVRQPAQRPLHQQSGEDADAHEHPHLLGAQPLARRVERRQAVERADHQPGHQHGGQRLRHALKEEARLQRRRVQWCGVNLVGDRHRHQAQGEAHGDHHRHFLPQPRMHHQHQLAEHQAEVGRHHVAGEHRAALAGVRLLVEPALDDHVLAHHPQADQHAQQQPHRQPGDQADTQHRCGDHAAAGDVGADVPDPGDQPVADLAAEHQAAVVGRHHAADPQSVDLALGEEQSQVGTEQTGAGQHHQGGEVESTEGGEYPLHRTSLVQTGGTARRQPLPRHLLNQHRGRVAARRGPCRAGSIASRAGARASPCPQARRHREGWIRPGRRGRDAPTA
ncbi:hypothetical protein D3C81_1005070 [compost metagenome]